MIVLLSIQGEIAGTSVAEPIFSFRPADYEVTTKNAIDVNIFTYTHGVRLRLSATPSKIKTRAFSRIPSFILVLFDEGSNRGKSES